MNSLSDYNGEFPFTAIFQDIEDKKLKEMTVPEQVWREAEEMFDSDTSNFVQFKYMAKKQDTKIEVL